jgi:hypothetical protein|tara:strand:- start:5458 stop:5775 length:318 start_codon:yes stop_codon:yes gene_type:complete
MAEANEPRKLVINNEDGTSNTYDINKMAPEAQNNYAKLELVAKELEQIRLQSGLKIEQMEVLQRHYLQEMKPFMTEETIHKQENYNFENGQPHEETSVEPQPTQN